MNFNFRKYLFRWDVLAILAIFIFLLLLFYFTFFTANYYPHKGPVKFDIKKGETLQRIADRLYEEKIIPGKTNFIIAAFIYGAEKKIRAARFFIPNGLSYLDLLDLFISGECDHLKSITIRPGQTTKWLAHRLQKYIQVDSTEFVIKTSDLNFIHSLGIDAKSLEGYFLPADYELYERSSAEEVLKSLCYSFKNFFTDSLVERTSEIGFTVHEVLTLASIIKGETDKVDEMSRISGVYHNRLRIGMKLQADPTVQYLLKNGWRKLTNKDLEIDSPYNTYKYFGLPPGPINNPGKDAILAALYPEKNKYLYFVADGNGGHTFAETLAGHNKNVINYRKLIKERNSNAKDFEK